MSGKCCQGNSYCVSKFITCRSLDGNCFLLSGQQWLSCSGCWIGPCSLRKMVRNFPVLSRFLAFSIVFNIDIMNRHFTSLRRAKRAGLVPICGLCAAGPYCGRAVEHKRRRVSAVEVRAVIFLALTRRSDAHVQWAMTCLGKGCALQLSDDILIGSCLHIYDRKTRHHLLASDG